MINVKKLLESINKSNVLIENSFAELDSKVDMGRKSRGNSMSAFYQSLDESSDGQVRTHWDVPSASQSGVKYKTIVEIIVPTSGGLFALAKGKWEPKKFKDILTKSDVRVHCNCYDFYWSGMMHNNGEHGRYKGSLAPNNTTLVKDAESDPRYPKIRDPQGSKTMCKHLHAVFKLFPTNAFTIMSQVRKYNNKTTTSQEKTDVVNDGNTPEEQIKEPVETEKNEPRAIPTEESKPILDSIFSAGEVMNNEIQSNASNMIDDQNEVAETEINKPEEEKPVSNIITDDTIEEEPEPTPVEPPSDIINPEPPPTTNIEPKKPTNILSGNDTKDIDDEIKKGTAGNIMNPTNK